MSNQQGEGITALEFLWMSMMLGIILAAIGFLVGTVWYGGIFMASLDLSPFGPWAWRGIIVGGTSLIVFCIWLDAHVRRDMPSRRDR